MHFLGDFSPFRIQTLIWSHLAMCMAKYGDDQCVFFSACTYLYASILSFSSPLSLKFQTHAFTHINNFNTIENIAIQQYYIHVLM